QRGLAGAVVPEQRAHRLRAQLEADVDQCALVAVALRDSLDLDVGERRHQSFSSSAISWSLRRESAAPDRSSSTSSSSRAAFFAAVAVDGTLAPRHNSAIPRPPRIITTTSIPTTRGTQTFHGGRSGRPLIVITIDLPRGIVMFSML